MSYTKRLVSLANSYKHGGVCIAGREITPQGYGSWIRPVSARPTQELFLADCHCPGTGSPRLLDIVDIAFQSPAPTHHQVENHLIDPTATWTRQGQLPLAELDKLWQQPPTLWPNTDRTCSGRFDCISQPEAFLQTTSLFLLKLRTLTVEVRTGHYTQRKQFRCLFHHNGTDYNLSLDRPGRQRSLRPPTPGQIHHARQSRSLPHHLPHRALQRRRTLPQTRSRHPRVRLTMEQAIYTIGHSNHPLEAFLSLLQTHAITVVADVRSQPYSRYNPHFDRESLKPALEDRNIRYVFLGRELGARSEDPRCYLRGKISFDRLAESPLFLEGIARLRKGHTTHRIALMCAEKEPLDCHRTILVSRELAKLDIPIRHILPDATLEDHADTIKRLADTLGLRDDIGHMFRTPDDLLEDAYRLQEKRIAYQDHAPEAPAA